MVAAPLTNRETRVGAVEADPASLLARVAERTRQYDFTVWFWGDAIAIDGLLDASEYGDDAAAGEHALRFLAKSPGTVPTWVDYLTPAGALLRAVQIHERPGFVDAARNLAVFFAEKVPRAPDGLHLFRPELPAYRHSVWIDSLYHIPSFLASLANVTGEENWRAECAHFVESHVAALRSSKGPLLAHSFDTGARVQKGYGWGRGQGWALLGLIDTIAFLPRGGARDNITAHFTKLAAAILPLQDQSGFWRTLAHDPEAYLEASTAAMIGAAFSKGCRLGLLGPEYAAASERAWRAMLSRLDQDGSLRGVSAVTWSWTSNLEEATMYKTLPTETNVWGQGGALRFVGERLLSQRASKSQS
jgi:unsaturated rhamnogalacturonyl hydrolase